MPSPRTTISDETLSAEQVRAFQREGVLGPLRVALPEEALDAVAALARGLASGAAAHPSAGQPTLQDRHLQEDALRALLGHPNLVRPLQQLMGRDLLLWRSAIHPGPTPARGLRPETSAAALQPAPAGDAPRNVTAWLALRGQAAPLDLGAQTLQEGELLLLAEGARSSASAGLAISWQVTPSTTWVYPEGAPAEAGLRQTEHQNVVLSGRSRERRNPIAPPLGSPGGQPPQQRLLPLVYRLELERMEAVERSGLDREALTELGRLANSLHRTLEDYQLEGYGRFVEEAVTTLRAPERLDALVDGVVDQLGAESGRALYGIHPEPILEPTLDTSGPTRRWPLEAWLEELDRRAQVPWDTRPCFADEATAALWMAQTQAKADELMRFVGWLVDEMTRAPDHVPVFLLRDTLLPLLCYRWLRRGGAPLPPERALLFNRAHLYAEGVTDPQYSAVAGLIYQAQLLEGVQIDFTALRATFDRLTPTLRWLSPDFSASTRRTLAALCEGSPPLFIESGFLGTFPLWLLSMVEGGDMRMYTSAPWLYGVYGARIFSHDYSYLRALESLVVHEQLFQLDPAHPGGGVIAASLDTHTNALAGAELHAAWRAASAWLQGDPLK